MFLLDKIILKLFIYIYIYIYIYKVENPNNIE